MYIFRPLRFTQCSDDWVFLDPVYLYNFTDPSYTPSPWGSIPTIMVGDTVTYKGYDFTSLKDNNTDDPSKNYIGRAARSGDEANGYGKNSWVRAGVTNKYKCFIPQSSGYTESWGVLSGGLVISQYSDNIDKIVAPQEMLFMLLNGVVGSSVTVDAYNYADSQLAGAIKTATVVTESFPNMDIGSVLNPELPSVAKSFLYSVVMGSSANTDVLVADSTRFGVAPYNNAFSSSGVVFTENIFLGRLSHIGNMQWSNHKYSVSDRSKIVTDAWGNMSLSKRRVARTVDCEVKITPKQGETIAERLNLVYRYLLAIRGTVNTFIMNNAEISFATQYQLYDIPYVDVVTGILKSAKISGISGTHATVSITIESIPTAYEYQFPNVAEG